jgi:diguanylate cyclase (GGDEF)-like protein
MWAMPLSWLAFLASVIWRPERGQYDPWLDVGLYDIPFALAAIACWRGDEQRDVGDVGRRAWRILGSGLVVFVCGNVYGSIVVGDRDIYPSPADGMWLTFYVLLYVAIIGLVRSRVTRFSPSSWLDGGVAGLGVAALVVAFALGPALEITGGRFSVVATNLAYPAAELVLIVVLVTSVVAIRANDTSFWLLGAGIAVFGVSDVLYMFLEASDAYAEGGLLDVGWPLGAVLIGCAACAAAGAHPPATDIGQRFTIPTVFAATSVGLLIVGQRRDLSMAAIALAVGSLVVAAARVALTVHEVRALAASRVEARTDELTGLANRRRLLELLDDSVDAPDTTLALLIIDLDRFKEVNDSLGHVAGDELLRHVAGRLLDAVPPDVVVARLGGDEFALVVRNIDVDEAVAIGEHVRTALAEPFELAGMPIIADASIGVACSPQHGTTAAAILSHSDIAMYRAKRDRTGVEAYSAAADTLSPDHFELLADLRTAFTEHQFALHYQPQLDLRSGEVVGVEALVRWNHPERGLVPPHVFLPMLEQTNQMRALTSVVLRRSLADAAALSRAGVPLRMSVNISASDLVHEQLADDITRLLDQVGLRPEMLVIEVTEDTVMIDRVRSLRTLHQIRARGVHISVDDYGTGRASLSYIRDLPITELKLDRSFLEGVPHDTHNAAIVRSTIELAHSLDLPLVAEGVEDIEALEWLSLLGCDVGQGYHISRPMPIDMLRSWLLARSAPTKEPDVEPTRSLRVVEMM